jgi:hypothetical protein
MSFFPPLKSLLYCHRVLDNRIDAGVLLDGELHGGIGWVDDQ